MVYLIFKIWGKLSAAAFSGMAVNFIKSYVISTEKFNTEKAHEVYMR